MGVSHALRKRMTDATTPTLKPIPLQAEQIIIISAIARKVVRGVGETHDLTSKSATDTARADAYTRAS